MSLLLPLYVARDSQRALDLLFSNCEADTSCAKRYPELRGRFESLVCSEDASLIEDEAIIRETKGTWMGEAALRNMLKPCAFWPRGEVLSTLTGRVLTGASATHRDSTCARSTRMKILVDHFAQYAAKCNRPRKIGPAPPTPRLRPGVRKSFARTFMQPLKVLRNLRTHER